MNQRLILGLLFIFVLFSAGLFLFRANNSLSPALASGEGADFRVWLWEKRSLDLVVHVLLVFGGALGIAAILPIEGADE